MNQIIIYAVESFNSHKKFVEEQIYNERYTFAGGVFFNRMKELGLYSMDIGDIAERVDKAGLKGIFG